MTAATPTAEATNTSWRRLFRYVRPYRFRLVVAMLMLIGSTAIGLVLPLAVRGLINIIADSANSSLLDQVALVLVGFFLLQMVLNVIQTYFLTYIGERVIADLRIQVYTHLQKLSLTFFNSRQIGEITSRVTNDVTIIQTVTSNSVANLIQNILSFIGSFILMVQLSWQLTGVALLVIPFLVVISLFFGKQLRKVSTDVQDRVADATAVLEETLSAVRVVQSFARQPHEIKRFSTAIERGFQAAMRRARINAYFLPMVIFLGFSGLVLVIWFGGRQVLDGRMTLGDMVAFLLYAGSIAGALGGFTGIYSQLQEALGATARVFGLLDIEPDIADRPNAQPLPTIVGRVCLDHVAFTYEADSTHHVLHDISLDVQPGEVLALVGPSGAGKTTLIDLIPRFYDVSAGSIRIDNLDIRDVQLHSLRSQIGIVPQETLLFSGTIGDNIRYGNLNASEAEVIEAAKAANAHDFIERSEQGYNTLVGERGVKLSGGQRQRIAIARAILKDPRILILDEATSAMDSESEGLVQEALERLMRNRTTFIIAHRLSTIKNASRIAVIDRGRLVELGTHTELLLKGGLYARLYALQFSRSGAEGNEVNDPQEVGTAHTDAIVYEEFSKQ